MDEKIKNALEKKSSAEKQLFVDCATIVLNVYHANGHIEPNSREARLQNVIINFMENNGIHAQINKVCETIIACG